MSGDMVKVGDTGEYDEWVEAEKKRKERRERELLDFFPQPDPSFLKKAALRLWLTRKRIAWFFEGKLGKNGGTDE